MLLINVYHRCQILSTSTDTGYNICAICTFFANDTISIYDLKRRINVNLEIFPSHFNLIISARINTAQPSSGDFLIVYLRWFLRKFKE
jgi:hypothetical protein